MPAVRIRSEKTGQSWRVWPDAEEIAAGVIQEAGSYFFELEDSSEAATAELLIDEVPLEALRAPSSDTARWRWSPGFHAGSVEIELRLQGRTPRRFEIVTDPDRRKLTRDDFDGMVREILDDTFALFSLSGFRKGLARGAGERAPPVARLEFLRSRIAELEQVVADIAARPRRRLTAVEVVLPHHRARGVRGPEILKAMRNGRVLRETAAVSRLPAALKGFLPDQIAVIRRQSSSDFAEHRQMAACLRSWASWLGNISDLLAARSADANTEAATGAAGWSVRCRRLARRVSLLARSEPFADVGEAPARLTLTPIFRSDPLYRRFYRLWQDINRGIASVFGDFLNLPLARTFELYELWCFLRLVRAAAEAYGPEGLQVKDLFISDARGGVTIATGAVTIPVGGGWTLCFQKQYREFWVEPDGQGSYSRAMAPDVVMAQELSGQDAAASLIVLDAKYRINDGLNDALNSIHTYRDALVREAASGQTEGVVTAAYLLTPYAPSLGAGYRDTPMPARLFHPEYRAGFRFGAVTLHPGMSPSQTAEALRLIVADATMVAGGAA